MGTKNYSSYSDMITFSRASSGTALAKISYGAELVTNGTFDTDASGWTYDTPANLPVVGGELEWTYDGTDGFAYQIITTEIGKFYQISADLRRGTAVNAITLRVGTSDGSSANVGISSGTTTTTTFVRTFVATATNTYISIGGGVTAAGQTNYYDNITVREVLYDQPDGTLQLFNHPANQPRVEYDYQGNRLGLLVEEARTNLLLNSRIASGGVLATGWNVQGATASAPTSTAPDGSTDGVAVSITTNTGNNLAYLLPGLTIGQTYTASMWLKGVAGDQIYFNAEDAAAAQELVTFTGDWQRVSKTYTATSTSQYFACEIFNRSGGAHLPNVSFEAWGAQYELGSFPTSYIPTSGATATRSADVASIGVGAFGYNKGAGTVLITYELPDDTVAYLFELDDPASGNNRWVMYRNGVNLRKAVIRAGSNIHDSVVTSTLPPGTNIAAMSVDDTVVKGVSNGEAVTSTAGNFAVETGITQLTLGSNRGVGSWLNSHISSIAYYPRRLTNAQIKALTSPPETPTLSLTFDDSSTSYLETSIHG